MKRMIFVLFIITYSMGVFCALPDVDLEIIGPAVLDPPEPVFSDKVTITLYLYNYGPEDIKGPIKADWRINGKSIGQSVIMGLPAGEQKELKNSFKVKDKVNKLKVSIITTMVPFLDNFPDNNIYEEEISLFNLTTDDNNPNSDQNLGLINNGITGKKQNEKTRVEETTGTTNNNGNPSNSGSAGSASGTSGKQTSNKAVGNRQTSPDGDKSQGSEQSKNSSSTNTSNKESRTNPNSNTVPTFDNSELTRAFADYVTSYIKLNAKINETLARESDAARKSTLSALKKDIDSIHSLLVSVNKTNTNGSTSTREANIDWNALEDLLSKIESQLGNFDEMDSTRDNYVDNADDFISKSKEKLGD